MRAFWMIAVLAASAPAHAESLWEAELRVGYGVSSAGSGGMTTMRSSPLTVGAIAAIAIREEPRLFGYGGLTAETLDRNAVGAVAGVRLEPRGMPVRLAGGAAYMIAPFSLAGATGSIGACLRGMPTICGDVQLTAYFAGSDLAEGRTVTQIQGVLGVVFDAL